MKIAVLQLARFGDIIQTLPMIQGLKKKHPDSEITLVVRSTFVGAARLSPHVDKIVEFPTASVLGPVLTDGADGKAAAGLELARWISGAFGAEEYDLLLNVTFTRASAYLASLINAKDKRGTLASKAIGQDFVIRDPWSQYFFSQVLEHNMNIIHLNDLFPRIAGAMEGCWPLELRDVRPSIAVAPVPAGKIRIGIQVGASSPEKTLNAPTWTKLCKALLTFHENAELCFFGNAAEREVVVSILDAIEDEAAGLASKRCILPIGMLKFEENAAWVRSCDWLISPDTAIVHLASAVGTRVIEIPVGGVRPEETGPYGEGHHIVYVANADAEQLALQIASIVGGQKASTCVAEAITRLTPTSSGIPRHEIVAHNFIQEETSGFFMQAYYLLAEFRCGGRLEDIPVPNIGDPGQPTALDRLVSAYDALCTTRRLAEFGQHYCLKMLENLDDRELLTAHMEKIAELEDLLVKMQKSVPLAKPLIDTWRVAKDVAYAPEADAGGLAEVLALTEGCYRELGQNIEIIQQLLQTAVETAQAKRSSKTVVPENKEML